MMTYVRPAKIAFDLMPIKCLFVCSPGDTAGVFLGPFCISQGGEDPATLLIVLNYHLQSSFLQPSSVILVIFHHILIFFSTNHTPHSHGWQTVSTNTTSCGRICFLVFKRRSRPDSGLQRSFIDSRECGHSISFFQGFALWVFQQVVKERKKKID